MSHHVQIIRKSYRLLILMAEIVNASKGCEDKMMYLCHKDLSRIGSVLAIYLLGLLIADDWSLPCVGDRIRKVLGPYDLISKENENSTSQMSCFSNLLYCVENEGISFLYRGGENFLSEVCSHKLLNRAELSGPLVESLVDGTKKAGLGVHQCLGNHCLVAARLLAIRPTQLSINDIVTSISTHLVC